MRNLLFAITILCGCSRLVGLDEADPGSGTLGEGDPCVTVNGQGKLVPVCGGRGCPACAGEPCSIDVPCVAGLICNGQCVPDFSSRSIEAQRPATWMALGRFIGDRDEFLDLAIESEADGEIRVFPGNGPFGFSADGGSFSTKLPAPGPITVMEDRDAPCSDLLYFARSSPGLRRLPCDGAGGFTLPQEPLPGTNTTRFEELRALSGEGQFRLFALGEGWLYRLSGPAPALIRMRPARSFAIAPPAASPLIAWEPGTDDHGIWPLYAARDGGAIPLRRDALPVEAKLSRSPRLVAAGRFDDDDLDDLLVRLGDEPTLTLIRGEAGGFGARVGTDLPGDLVESLRSQRAAVDDFNGDGRDDVAFVTGDGALHVHFNGGAPSFLPPRRPWPFYDAVLSRWRRQPDDRAISLLARDIDADGATDLVLNVVAQNGSPAIWTLQSQSNPAPIAPPLPTPAPRRFQDPPRNLERNDRVSP